MAGRRPWRSPLVAGTALALAVVLAGGAGVLALADASARTFPPGTVVEGVAVGGLGLDDAVARLRPALEAPLRRPVTLRAERFEEITSPWDLGLRVDVAAIARRALRSRAGANLATRLGDRLLGSSGTRMVAATPVWGRGELDGLLRRAAAVVADAPRDADIDVSSGWVRFVPARGGQALDAEASRRAVMEGVVLGDETVRLVTRPLGPGGSDPSSAKVILVRTGENRLYLYEGGRVVQSWPVATGLPDYPTPTGVFRVVAKLVDPVWYNPGSRWARNLPTRIGPGRSNPLGTHALELDAPSILIHATPDTGSIGFNVSHGCIRMTEADELELFGQVTVGTRVAVVATEPPRARESVPPAPTSPERAAAVVF